MNTETCDLLTGTYKIFQYQKGHRYSTDDLLVAWFGLSQIEKPNRILDLGCGLGTIGMIASWKYPNASIVGIEAQSMSVALARKSIELNSLANRFEIREGDFRDPSLFLKVESRNESFDLIIGSPPYFALSEGIQSPHPQKAACRFELCGTVMDYCEVASQHLNQDAVFACVYPIRPKFQEMKILKGIERSNLELVRRRDVVLREGESPLLGLFLMKKRKSEQTFKYAFESDLPLIIRQRNGEIHPEYSMIKKWIGFSL